MAFSDKKFKKVDYTNILEIIDALNLNESIKALLRVKDSTTRFIKNDDGTWTYKIETAEKALLDETFPLDKEVEFKRPDGQVYKTKFWFEGENTLKQTMSNFEGKTLHFDRTFDGDKMTMTVKMDGLDITGTVVYGAV